MLHQLSQYGLRMIADQLQASPSSRAMEHMLSHLIRPSPMNKALCSRIVLLLYGILY